VTAQRLLASECRLDPLRGGGQHGQRDQQPEPAFGERPEGERSERVGGGGHDGGPRSDGQADGRPIHQDRGEGRPGDQDRLLRQLRIAQRREGKGSQGTKSRARCERPTERRRPHGRRQFDEQVTESSGECGERTADERLRPEQLPHRDGADDDGQERADDHRVGADQ
jgi:hypothetical protein